MIDSQETSPLFYRNNFNIIDMIKTSYHYTKGFKATIWIIAIIWGILLLTKFQVTGLFFPDQDLTSEQFQQFYKIIGLISIPITAPLGAGISMTIISYLRGITVSYTFIFNYYNIIWKLSLASLFIHMLNYSINFAITSIGNYLQLEWLTFLSTILSISIAMIYMFTLPLIADKELKIWDAMELSRKAVFSHFFSIFILYILLVIIMAISAIPLGIGMIWTIPMVLITFYGLLYRVIFDGVSYDIEEKIIAQ